MDGLGMSIVVQVRFFVNGPGDGEWLPWEDYELDEPYGLNGDDVPGYGLAVMYEVRIKPAFEPGHFVELNNGMVLKDARVEYFLKEPDPNMWKRVRLVY